MSGRRARPRQHRALHVIHHIGFACCRLQAASQNQTTDGAHALRGTTAHTNSKAAMGQLCSHQQCSSTLSSQQMAPTCAIVACTPTSIVRQPHVWLCAAIVSDIGLPACNAQVKPQTMHRPRSPRPVPIPVPLTDPRPISTPPEEQQPVDNAPMLVV